MKASGRCRGPGAEPPRRAGRPRMSLSVRSSRFSRPSAVVLRLIHILGRPEGRAPPSLDMDLAMASSGARNQANLSFSAIGPVASMRSRSPWFSILKVWTRACPSAACGGTVLLDNLLDRRSPSPRPRARSSPDRSLRNTEDGPSSTNHRRFELRRPTGETQAAVGAALLLEEALHYYTSRRRRPLRCGGQGSNCAFEPSPVRMSDGCPDA